jgi:hypothetical protein
VVGIGDWDPGLPGEVPRLEAGAGEEDHLIAAQHLPRPLALPHFFFLRPFLSRVIAGSTIIYAIVHHARRGMRKTWKTGARLKCRGSARMAQFEWTFTASPNASRKTNAGTYGTNCSSSSSLFSSPECHRPCPHTWKGATIHRLRCLFWPEKKANSKKKKKSQNRHRSDTSLPRKGRSAQSQLDPSRDNKRTLGMLPVPSGSRPPSLCLVRGLVKVVC